MSPTEIATLTTSLTLVATEAIKGISGSAGKDLWSKIKTKLGWKIDPPEDQLQTEMASKLNEDHSLALELIELLKLSAPSNEIGSVFAKDITANKAIIGSNINVGGDLRM